MRSGDFLRKIAASFAVQSVWKTDANKARARKAEKEITKYNILEKNTLKPDFLWSKLFLCMIRKNMSCLLLIYIKLVKICSTRLC